MWPCRSIHHRIEEMIDARNTLMTLLILEQ